MQRARPIHPKTIFNKQMTELRKKYLNEHLQNQKSLKEKQQQIEQQQTEIREFKDLDIKKYKQEKMDLLKGESYSEWKEFIDKRKKERLANYLSNQKKISDKRMNSLVYLLNNSVSFVTYENMNSYIQKVLANPISNNNSLEYLKNHYENEREMVLKDLVKGTWKDTEGIDLIKQRMAYLKKMQE
ncbi:hypothetical protein HK103_006075 [Boothiomyces macroporosus]|uniref:Uncharacterized protein n=1 Tax=Boothiomyces macroporosus TaxID=261099 RepID=A0AAD5UE70_9FUNG|nr:hypothetical protein HK103_006075 [Boothiomyces macroporosus]KAJ3310274.1 hypothetical protein HDV04_005119 [Boothiomyces sp. JEL0838]